MGGCDTSPFLDMSWRYELAVCMTLEVKQQDRRFVGTRKLHRFGGVLIGFCPANWDVWTFGCFFLAPSAQLVAPARLASRPQ